MHHYNNRNICVNFQKKNIQGKQFQEVGFELSVCFSLSHCRQYLQGKAVILLKMLVRSLNTNFEVIYDLQTSKDKVVSVSSTKPKDTPCSSSRKTEKVKIVDYACMLEKCKPDDLEVSHELRCLIMSILKESEFKKLLFDDISMMLARIFPYFHSIPIWTLNSDLKKACKDKYPSFDGFDLQISGSYCKLVVKKPIRTNDHLEKDHKNQKVLNNSEPKQDTSSKSSPISEDSKNTKAETIVKKQSFTWKYMLTEVLRKCRKPHNEKEIVRRVQNVFSQNIVVEREEIKRAVSLNLRSFPIFKRNENKCWSLVRGKK